MVKDGKEITAEESIKTEFIDLSKRCRGYYPRFSC